MPKLDEDKQRARQENILNAAEQCFSSHGFHSTSMQDICREAGISPGTLYLYFRSKEELIAAICEREQSAFSQQLTAIADVPDFMAALKQLGDTYCLAQPHSKFCFQVEMKAEALRNQEIGNTLRKSHDFVIENFTKIIEEAKSKGRIDPAADPAILAQILKIIGEGFYLLRALDPNFNTKQCMDVIMSMLALVFRSVDAVEAGEDVPPRGEHEPVS